MNNAKIAQSNIEFEQEFDRLPMLRQREGELVKIIEAISVVSELDSWKVLKDYIFEGLVETLERRLKNEADKEDLNHSEIHRLQGQLIWARKYADFKKLSDAFRLELTNVRNQIKAKEIKS